MQKRNPQHPDLIDQSVNHMKGMAEKTKECIYLLDEEMEVPEGLTKGAKKIFEETIAKYNKLYEQTGVRIVCNLDSTLLRSYCNYHDILDGLYKELGKSSKVFVNETRTSKKKKVKEDDYDEDTRESSKQVINPLYAEIRKVEQRLTTLADKLYLTPMGRVATANIQTRKKKQDKFDAFMREIE